LKLKGLAPATPVKPCFLKDNDQSATGAGGVKVASKIGKTFGLEHFSSREPAAGIELRGVSCTLSRS
jgi:hypothetical protein